MTLGQYPDEVPQNLLIPPEIFTSDYDIGGFPRCRPPIGARCGGTLRGGPLWKTLTATATSISWLHLGDWRDPLRYFRNQADGTFADHTQAAGLAGIVGGLNICQADYDNNGYADVLVLRGAWLDGGRYPNSLLANRGNGRFFRCDRGRRLAHFPPNPDRGLGAISTTTVGSTYLSATNLRVAPFIRASCSATKAKTLGAEYRRYNSSM